MPQHFDSSFHPRTSCPLRMPRSSRSCMAAVCAPAIFAAAALLVAVAAACAADTMADGARFDILQQPYAYLIGRAKISRVASKPVW